VEGNIGAGKSTFLKFLSQSLNGVQLITEPIDAWTDFDGQNLLQLFYEDPSRWAYAFQMFAFYSRVKQLAELEPKNDSSVQSFPRKKSGVIRIHERCTYSDREIFATNSYISGLFQPAEWSLYKDQFDFLHDQFPPRIDGFIYLRTSPEMAFSRLKIRSREEEKTVSKEYLGALHSLHEQWLNSSSVPIDDSKNRTTELAKFNPQVWLGSALAGDADVPVLVINADIDFENTPLVAEFYVEQVRNFLKRISIGV